MGIRTNSGDCRPAAPPASCRQLCRLSSLPGQLRPLGADGIRALPFFVCWCFLPLTESACCCFIRPWGKPGPARLPAQSPWEAASREGADIQAQSPASGDWWLGHPLPAPDPSSSSLSAWPRKPALPWHVLGPHSLSVTAVPRDNKCLGELCPQLRASSLVAHNLGFLKDQG